MKFMVTMKDPDSLHDAVRRAVNAEVCALVESDEEAEALGEIRAEKVMDVCRRWFEHGEYLTVEIDTDAGTIRVVVVSRGAK